MAQWLTAQVVARTAWNPRLCSLTLAANLANFKAGQFVNLALEVEGKPLVRPYSLVNPPGSAQVEVLFNRVEGGQLSERLFALTPGDTVLCGPVAQGMFTLPAHSGQYLWLLATGSGVGPYLSMLSSGQPWAQFERVILVQSVYDQSEMVYPDQLAAWEQAYPGRFSRLYSLTRTPAPGHLHARLPDLLASGELERAAGANLSAENSHVMLCGNPGMVRSTLALLEARGLTKHQRFAPGQISLEIY